MSTSSGSGHGTKRRRLPSLGLSCGLKRRAVGAATPQVRRALDDVSALEAVRLPFSVLADGPYFDVASWLDATDLARTDASCRLLRSLNSQPHGPWQTLG